MKNWKYIDGAKVGNIKDDKKAQQLWDEMQHAKKLAEDWAREIHRTGKEEYKGSQKDAEEAYRKAKREYEKYAMNAKTGNAESFDEFVKKLAKEKPELYQSLWNAGQMEALKSYYHKITGNATPAEYFSKKPKVIGNEKTGAEGFFKQLSDDVKEREKKDDADIEKVGNARYTTREDVISHLDTDLYDICKKVPAGSPSFAYVSELQKKGWDISTISKYTKEIGKIIDQYKVGNSIGGGVQSETVLTEAKDGSQYWVEKTSKSGQYAQYNLYYTIGQGKRHAGVFKDKEAAADAGRRIIGNSASDGKFAYVMREFDEGKLKTPDGKVVTDPEQAKAIAYSESKKTENGLARARNAIKKS